MKVIYVIHADDGSVKIGVSANPKRRLNAIRTQSGKAFIETYCTDFCSNAFQIESFMKKRYKENHISGEWFYIDYKEAVKTLKSAFNEMAKFEDKADETKELMNDFCDFATGYTRKINREYLTDICGDEAITKIENTIVALNHYLLNSNDSNYSAGVFKNLFKIAYQLVGINEAGGLTKLSDSELYSVYTYEQIISDCIRSGIDANLDYKQIYKECKARCYAAQQIAMIGVS